MIPLNRNPVRIKIISLSGQWQLYKKLHDSVLVRERANSETEESQLTRTKEEKETPFLIYSLNRKEQVDSKNHQLRAAAPTRDTPTIHTKAQERASWLFWEEASPSPDPGPNLGIKAL